MRWFRLDTHAPQPRHPPRALRGDRPPWRRRHGRGPAKPSLDPHGDQVAEDADENMLVLRGGDSSRSRVNSNERFSARHGIEPDEAEITVREDAPAEFRGAFVQIAYESGLSPTQLRGIVCGVLRAEPDSLNWSDFPNVDEEVRQRVGECAWFEVYDSVEAVDQALRSGRPGSGLTPRPDIFDREINKCFRKAGIGWQLADGRIEVRGAETFNRPVADAVERLKAAGLHTAKVELHEALQSMSRRPQPDLTGAIQHALAALECTARQICGDPNPTLGQLLKHHPDLIPAPLNQSVEKAWGFASQHARHLQEGQELDYAEVELVVGLAATVAGYLVTKHRG